MLPKLKIKSKFWFIVVLSYWLAPLTFYFVIGARGIDTYLMLVIVAHFFGDFVISAIMMYTSAFELIKKKEEEVGLDDNRANVQVKV